MFGIRELKKKIEKLERYNDDLCMRLWKLENPPKYKVGDKVGKATVKSISCTAHRMLGVVYTYEYKYEIN